MFKKFFFFLFSTLAINGMSQDHIDWTAGWDHKTLNQARNLPSSKMNEVEENVLFYCNLARMNPKLFLTTTLSLYIEVRAVKNSSYLSSLKRFLKKSKKLPPFIANDSLHKVAEIHAVHSGKKGTIGHQNYSKRFKYVEDVFPTNGENCDYGNQKAIDIVFSWLIDEGIANLGHRKNVFDKEFSHAAVSIAPHKSYQVNAVMAFGSR